MQEPILPPDMAWHPPHAGWGSPGSQHLRLGGQYGIEVAIVSCRVDGRGWVSVVNRQLPYERRRSVVAPTLDLAKKWAGRWVLGRAVALRAAAAARAQPHGAWRAFDRPLGPGPEGPSNGL